MPELPEVETTVESLKKEVLKRTFVDVWALERPHPVEKVKGKKLTDVFRKGKFIIFLLNDNKAMVVHLRMTGHFLLGNWKREKGEWKGEGARSEKVNGYLRFIFFLDNGKQLALSDARKFARIDVLPCSKLDNYFKKMGPDILSLNKSDFIDILKKRKREVKPLIIDQGCISGVGNIYASEALFLSGIHPKKKAHALSTKEAEGLLKNLQYVMEKSIRLKGDSTSDYRLLDGTKGGYQNNHLVYRREGKPCFSCGEKIKRTVVGGRGTYYCPCCQNV